jgi:chromosome segregation ATPase
MKHDTLEAATEQFRLKAKSMKQKLEEERKRYDTVVHEKEALEAEMHERIEAALKKETAKFDEYRDQQAEKGARLEKEIGRLSEQLETFQSESSRRQKDLAAKLMDERNQYEMLKQSSLKIEEELNKEISILTERLNDSEQQAISLEQSLKATLADEKEKDDLHQKELRMRIEEASRWEARIKELNLEKTSLYSDLKRKESVLLDTNRMVSALEQKLTITQNQVMALEETIEELVRERNSQEMENANLHAAVRESTQLLERAEKTAKDAIDKTTNMSLAYDEAQRQLKAERQKLNQTASVLEELERTTQEYHFLRQEMFSVKDQLNTTNTESLKCKRAFEKLRLEYDELDVSFMRSQANFNQTIDELQQQSRALRDVQKEHARLRHEFESTKNESMRVQKESAFKQEEVESVQTKYLELELVALQQHKELARLKQEIEETAAQLSVTRSFAKELEESKLLCEGEKSQFQSLYVEVENMTVSYNKELAQVRSQNAGLLSQISEAQRKAKESRALLESCKVGHRSGNWVTSVTSLYHWLDYKLYQILRFIVELPGYIFPNSVSDELHSAAASSWSKASMTLKSPCRTMSALHGVCLSVFQRVIATTSDFLTSRSGGKNGSSWAFSCLQGLLSFAQNHSNFLVMVTEGVLSLLCIDFILSSLLFRQPTRRKPTVVKTPKTEVGSLLRKAKNFEK